MLYKSDIEVLKDLKAGITHPVYFLMGDEAYFIDKIADYIQSNILNETEREFDQQVLYGDDVTMESVVDAAKQFPMLSSRQVIILREAQLIRNIDVLAQYAEKPLSSTILVVVYRKSLDKRTKLYKTLKSNGGVLDSVKLKDYMVRDWISRYVKEAGYSIDNRSAELLSEFLGNDLSKIANEVSKLVLTLAPGTISITGEHIERNIGISKDFNNFELQDALVARDVLKANRIIDYFAKNPGKNPMVLTISALFSFYSNLMIIHYLPVKTEASITSSLHVIPFVARKLIAASRIYTAGKVFRIIALLRDYDARSKGVDNSTVSHGELLKELVFKIVH